MSHRARSFPLAAVVGVLAALVGLLAGVRPAAAADPVIRLVSPKPGATLVGPVTIAFTLDGVAPDDVARATVALDGRDVATLTAPPWSATADAGDELREHRIDVRVQLRSGAIVKRGFTTARPLTSEIEVRLVNLGVSVTDSSGRSVMDLAKRDFHVLDAGQPVEIERFEAVPAPLAIALVMDMSGSMAGDKLAEARRAAKALLKELGPKDRVMVLSFSDDVQELVPLTADFDAAAGAINGLVSQGGTALYDAVCKASDVLAKVPTGYRRVILLLSDGRDEAASGLEPGSFHTLDESVHKASRADASIFAVGLGAELDRETDFNGRLTTAQVLERLANTSGGTFRKITWWTRIGGAFRDVLTELRHQYWIAYRPPDRRPGESWRPITVTVSKPELRVKTREGYFVD